MDRFFLIPLKENVFNCIVGNSNICLMRINKSFDFIFFPPEKYSYQLIDEKTEFLPRQSSQFGGSLQGDSGGLNYNSSSIHICVLCPSAQLLHSQIPHFEK